MVKEVRREVERRMKASVEAIGRELARIRTGRASLAVLDGVQVDYYGTPTPLAQVARLSVPESNLILIQPWDPKVLEPIEKAILKADLGLNPVNDGKLLRLPIPPLTEERRRELAKKVARIGEEGKTELRHHRREGNEQLRKLRTDKRITEDEEHQGQAEVQKMTDKFGSALEDLMKNKEREILTV